MEPTPPIPIAVITGFSGSGKTTLYRELMSRHGDRLIKVPTTTTRPPREGDMPGVDYSHVDHDTFHRLKDEGAFMEWSQHYDNFYASPHPHTIKRQDGQVLLYLLDMNGVVSMKKHHPHAHSFFIYITPEEQIRRLESVRGTDAAGHAARIERYRHEEAMMKEHEHLLHILPNEQLDDLPKVIEHIRTTLEI